MMRFLSGLACAVVLCAADIQPLTKQGEIYSLSDNWRYQRGDDPSWTLPAFAKQELFGFDRTREISTKSSTEIDQAAKAWGQNEDITVLTARRNS